MKRIKKLSILSMLLMISILQMGCARITLEGSVNKDKTIDIVYLIATNDTENPLSYSEELEKEFENAGYKSTPYEKDGYKGLLLSKTFNLDDLCNDAPSILSPLSVETKEENIYTIKFKPEALIAESKLKETFDESHSKTTQSAIEEENGYIGMIINLPYEAIKDNADYKKNNCTSYGWDIYAIDREIPEVTFNITKSGKTTPVWKIVLMVIGILLFMVITILLNYMSYIDKKKEEENE